MIAAVSTISFFVSSYRCLDFHYLSVLEMELKEEYDENAYGSRSRGSSGATLQPSNAQNVTGNLLSLVIYSG